jgi:alpha-D-ribose 1-methylphosphonate 5-triphosphate diphosphatase
MTLSILGGRVLLQHDGLQSVGLTLNEDRIAAIDCIGGGLRLDATGLLVLPGIIDIHGDAFERQLQPRPGVDFPADIALMDTEAQLLANGITTAFHGVTLSWEPGLRSREAWRSVLGGLASRHWACDMRVHLRWEAYNLDALEMALADIAAGRVHLLAFNDHTPAILREIEDPLTGARYSERAGVKLIELRSLAREVGGRGSDVPAALERISAAARAAGIPLASHDDESITARDAFRAQGAHICEFPKTEEVARSARAAGDFVVMGSPNVVRGRSHLGWASAARMAEDGVCSVLSSDYFYPAMMRAALTLAGRGILNLERAWALISANPAAATGLSDRGAIAEGKRADLVVVEPTSRRAVATIAGGRVAYLSTEGAMRLSWA